MERSILIRLLEEVQAPAVRLPGLEIYVPKPEDVLSALHQHATVAHWGEGLREAWRFFEIVFKKERLGYFWNLLSKGWQFMFTSLGLKALAVVPFYTAAVAQANYRSIWQLRATHWMRWVNPEGQPLFRSPEVTLRQVTEEVSRYVGQTVQSYLTDFFRKYVEPSSILTPQEKALIREFLVDLTGREVKLPSWEEIMELKGKLPDAMILRNAPPALEFTWPAKEKTKDLLEFAPLFSGYSFGYSPPSSGDELADALAKELEVNPTLLRAGLLALERKGKPFEKLDPDSKELFLRGIKDLQLTYDSLALTAFSIDDVKLRPNWASYRGIPLGFRIMYWFARDRPKERLSFFERTTLMLLVERLAEQVAAGEGTRTVISPGNIAHWSSYLATRIVEKKEEIRAKLEVEREIRHTDIPIFLDFVAGYALESGLRWLAEEAVRGRRYRSALEFADQLEGYLDYAINSAVERCKWAEWSITIYNEVVDKAVGLVAPYHPSSFWYKPARGWAQEALSDYWRKVRERLEETLREWLRPVNPARLPSQVEVLGRALSDLGELLPWGADDWRWRKYVALNVRAGPASSLDDYLDTLLSHVDNIVDSLVPVLATSRVIWANIYHFEWEGRRIVDALAEYILGYLSAGAGALPRVNPLSPVLSSVITAHLEEKGLAGRYSGWALAALEDRVMQRAMQDPEMAELVNYFLSERKFRPDMPEKALQFQEWAERVVPEILAEEEKRWRWWESLPLWQAAAEAPEIKKLAEEDLFGQAVSPDAKESPYGPYIDFWVRNILAYFGGADPDRVWEADEALAQEKGWQALKNYLAEALGASGDPEADIFLESRASLIMATLESVAWSFRLAREYYWDPEGALHIEVPEDVKKTWGKRIYRKPNQISYPREVAVLADFAGLTLVQLLRPLWASYKRILRDGVTREEELLLSLEEARASAKLLAFTSLHPGLPWFQKVLALGELDQKLTVGSDLVSRYFPQGRADLPSLLRARDDLLAQAKEILKGLPGPEEMVRSPESWQEALARANEVFSGIGLVPSRGSPRFASLQELEAYAREILDTWWKYFERTPVWGNPEVSYARFVTSVDWRSLFPDVENLEALYNQAKVEFAQKREELLASLRNILWQLPFTQPDVQVEEVKDTCYRLLTHQWELFWLAKAESARPKTDSFQGEARVDLSDPETNRRMYHQTLVALLSGPDGIIYRVKQYLVSVGRNPEPTVDLLMKKFSQAWEEWRKGQPVLTPADFERELLRFLADYEAEAWTTTIASLPGDADFADWLANIHNEDIPLQQRYIWWSMASASPHNPLARELVARGQDIPLRLGMAKDLNYIERQMLGFQERFTGVMRTAIMLQPQLTAKSRPPSDLSWEYLERIYAECVYPVEKAGLWPWLPAELRKWLELAKLMWEKKLVYPTARAQVEEIHQGFRWAISQALSNPEYVPFCYLWDLVRPALFNYIPTSYSAVSTLASVIWTNTLASRAKRRAYVDAGGRVYTEEEARAAADFELMLRLLEERNLNFFDNRWRYYWEPFIYQERYSSPWPDWARRGWFEVMGEILLRKRREVAGGRP